MKKEAIRGLFTVLIFIVILSTFAIFASSAEDTAVGAGGDSIAIDKAYQCLENLIKNKTTTTLSLQEAEFATLALGNKDNLKAKIDSERASANCWPKAGCKIKETARVLMSYQRAGWARGDIEKWLIGKNGTVSDLNWYLEIDMQNGKPAECSLRYDGSERKISIADDMKIGGSPGPCFTISSSGYWLAFRESCYDKEISISCNQDFITTLLYEKKSGGTLFVTSTTNSAASLGTTKEKVNAKCFKDGASCDYEGSLWAAIALQYSGKDADPYIPYLLALSENNLRYFPSAFLHILLSKSSGAEDQFSEIAQLQKQNQYWKIVGSPENEFYDTSLAMLSLKGTNSVELDNAKSYLSGIQTTEGCWNNNNIRDTAFILYSGWTRPPTGGTEVGGGSVLCESVAAYSCEIGDKCLAAGGRIQNNFECTGFGVCCSIKVPKLTCTEQGGDICSDSQACSGRIADSSDNGVCCLDSCVQRQEEFTCEPSGASCRSSCDSGEEEDSTKTCAQGSDVCCVIGESTPTNYTWVIILIILILLVLLAILFRHKLQLWWFKFKGKAKVTPTTKPGTPPLGNELSFAKFGPRPGAPPANAQRMQPFPQNRQPLRRMSPKDKELEDTLRKLKEMSK